MKTAQEHGVTLFRSELECGYHDKKSPRDESDKNPNYTNDDCSDNKFLVQQTF